MENVLQDVKPVLGYRSVPGNEYVYTRDRCNNCS